MSTEKQAGLALIREHALIADQAVTSAETIGVDDPSDGSVIGRVPKPSALQVE